MHPGWRVIVVTNRDLSRFPSQTLMRVALVLRERRSADVPAVLAPDRSMYLPPAVIPVRRRNTRHADTPVPPRHAGENAEQLASRQEGMRVAAG